jgi:predicted XRE-type DNA-binding protein
MSTNVYADIGIPNADEMMVKAGLVSHIEKIMSERNLTQAAVAQATGIIPGRISTMLRGQFHDISIERLIDAVRSLGCDVDIVVHRGGENGEAGKLAVLAAA